MPEYQLEIKQLVDYPRCRIYQEFAQPLIADQSIRTSYRRLDGITYTIYHGKWLCRISDLLSWFRVCYRCQALAIHSDLQERRLISFTQPGHGDLVKYCILEFSRNVLKTYECT